MTSEQLNKTNVCIGIDFATSSSVIGYINQYGGEIGTIKDEFGEVQIPTEIAFIDQKNILFGNQINNQDASIKLTKKQIVFDPKRFIGRSYKDIYNICSNYPFQIRQAIDNTVEFEIISDKETFWISPEKCYNLFFGYLEKIIQRCNDIHVQSVIISIPAAFTSRQRSATLKTGIKLFFYLFSRNFLLYYKDDKIIKFFINIFLFSRNFLLL